MGGSVVRCLSVVASVAALPGCSGYGCPTREERIDADDRAAGLTPGELLDRVPLRETLLVDPEAEVTDGSNGEKDLALAALAPFTVTVLEADLDGARLRTQYGAGDMCFVRDQLRIPLRIRVRSADGSLDLSTWGYAVATDGVPWFDGELDPETAMLVGDPGPALKAEIAETAARARRSSQCPDEPVVPMLRMHYDGEIGGPRELSFDVVVKDVGCVQMAAAAGSVDLLPKAR